MPRPTLPLLITPALLILFSGGLAAQKQQPKPPAFPPINPAVARLSQTISGLDGPGFGITYGEAADLLLAGCDKGTIQGWTKDVIMGIRTGSGTANLLKGHQGPVLGLAWNGGPLLASTGLDRKVLFWSVKDGIISKTLQSEALLRSLAMAPDGAVLAGGGEDEAVHLWDISAAKLRAKLIGHQDWVISLAFSPDSKLLASGDFHGTVLLWEMPEGKKLRELTPRPMPPPKVPPDPTPSGALAFSPDGKFIAVGDGNGLIQLVSVGDGKLIRPMPGHTSAVTALAFHPSGNLLVSASKDRTVRLWNPANGQLVKTLEGHEAWVEGVVFTAHGTRLASVGADQTVRLWDLTEAPKK
jgi:WD40 repeat protein